MIQIGLIYFLLCCIVFSSTAISQNDVKRIETANLVLENIPEIPASIQNKMHQYLSARSANVAGWVSSGSGMVITTRFGETQQIHYVESPGGARKQLTFFPEPVSSVSVCPNATNHCVLFNMDENGAENFQIYYLSLKDLSTKLITDRESRNGSAVWSNQGSRFAYHSTRRNQKDYDIYIDSIQNPRQPEMVLQVNGLWYPLDWSPDDNRLLLMQYISINESFLYVLDLPTKELTQINPADEKISYTDAKWSKDGSRIYFISDQGSAFRELRFQDIQTKQITPISSSIPWDISEMALSDNGQYMAFVSNENGISKLHLIISNNHQEIGTLPVPAGIISNLHFGPRGEKLAITIAMPTSPGDVYVIDIPKYDHFERWTFSETGGILSDRFVSPELVHYETFDEVNGSKRKIPAFYYKPQMPPQPKYPVLISIHGGPASQFRPSFNPFIQYAINEIGAAVIAPNVRGSNGYGKQYLQLDDGMLREDSVKDIGALLDWIATQPELDPNRVIVEGGSYGGYMVLASMVHFRERLLAGIDIVGISNFVTFLESTSEYRRDLRRAEYGDERIPEMREFLTKISPLTNASGINKPMLISQGLNDPRVPAGESEQIVQAIRANNIAVWYFLAKDEGHGFRKQTNRELYNQAAVLFLMTLYNQTG